MILGFVPTTVKVYTFRSQWLEILNSFNILHYIINNLLAVIEFYIELIIRQKLTLNFFFIDVYLTTCILRFCVQQSEQE